MLGPDSRSSALLKLLPGCSLQVALHRLPLVLHTTSKTKPFFVLKLPGNKVLDHIYVNRCDLQNKVTTCWLSIEELQIVVSVHDVNQNELKVVLYHRLR